MSTLKKNIAHAQGLIGSARSYFAAMRSGREAQRGALIIVPRTEDAEEVIEDLKLFLDPHLHQRIALFPEDDVPPYTALDADPSLEATRIEMLSRLLHGERRWIVVPIPALMRRLPPRQFLAESARTIRRGEKIDRDDLLKEMVALGYQDVPLVEDQGSYAVRGSILDFWPPSADTPLRLELVDDRIESLRHFQPESQRSRTEVQHVHLLPVRGFSFSRASRTEAAANIRKLGEASNMPGGERRALAEKLKEGIAFQGIKSFLACFHEKLETFFDFLPPETELFLFNPPSLREAADRAMKRAEELAATTTSVERIVPPIQILQTFSEIEEKMKLFSQLHFDDTLSPQLESNADLRAVNFAARCHEWLEQGLNVVVVAHTETQTARIRDLLGDVPILPFDTPFSHLKELRGKAVRLRIGRCSKGFRWMDEGLVLVTDEEIFGTRHARRRSATPPSEPFTSFQELADGDALVHEQHGIGRFRGLIHLQIDGIQGDYLLLEYLGGDKLYLPVYRMNFVQRYIGSGNDAPILDKLGGTRWSTLQAKVRKELRSIAKELLQISAERALKPGTAFPPTDLAYEEFCAAFPFDETTDQLRSIDDVNRDMDADRSMDRLICGDVGYGKTEVAMRAAFRAAFSGRQVAVLVPTTVLALQHFETFTQRFRETPIRIDMLSRFRTATEQRETLEALRAGKVDIVVGTHRLISKDVAFRDLGLLIIDEEHRFGVTHKEQIKKLKAIVDVLTLTATPIPRTLNLSLVGIRDMSIINTPPANRHAISTHLASFDPAALRHAILTEKERGGQVFFVHNRVETIHSMRERLQAIIPEVRIAVGHGQIKEEELEKIMIQFMHHEFDLLLCTTIIESGLDIPNANTIIIHRADTFGLAQLYQLRGRVGRSERHAFCYLLIPPEGNITPIAKRRLAALTRFTELGSGFQIAMHDLEIRGAGNILGRAQSGHVNAVGYELYTKLLARTIRQLRGREELEEIDPELHLKVEAFLPESYIEDNGARMELYRRLANRESEQEITELGEELLDRFGTLPPEAVNLLKLMEIKVLARKLRILTLTLDGTTLRCKLDASTPLDPLQTSKLARLIPPDRLELRSTSLSSPLDETKSLLRKLNHCVSSHA